MNGLNPSWLAGKATESTPARAPITPRANNYGRCLPWHTYGSTSAYRLAADRLRHMREFGGDAWALEMAMRDVRIADTQAERDRANAALIVLLHHTRSEVTQ